MTANSSKEKKCHFEEYKHVWNRVFFSPSYEKMKWPRGEVGQFWLFVRKYSNSQGNSKDNRDKRKEMCAKLLKKWSREIPDEWRDIEFLKSKIKSLNCDHYIGTRDIADFRDILLMFIDFGQNRKAKKIEKLKAFQKNLPIYQHRSNILDTIKSYSVILIAGDTGCGKSTQVPQYLLQAGYKNICCTQPRRLACIALRNRLSVETFDEYGSQIGYQIRFEKHKSKHTKILFLTEGLLLRQMTGDPFLANYNVIILDEIHERHLSCDFLLGAIKCLLARRRDDLKVILMSATVNCELFSHYFGSCPVVKIPGRLYPIKVEYFPIEKVTLFKTSKINPQPYLKLLQHIDEKFSDSERGDVLAFLSGFLEIETVGEALKEYADQTGKWIVLYLHSSLPVAEQDRVFDIAPDGVRKCVLATNIAETSLTIDGIRFVIDSGKVKEMYYDAMIRMQKLQEIWISKASAEQRKGRAGRTGPGVCYRLYAPQDFDSFLDFSTPEIRRVSLESLLLNMIAMGIDDVRQFPFLESPEAANIDRTIECLIGHDALDEAEKITLMGRILSKLPVDISIGKMLIMAVGQNLVDYFLSAAACLSVTTFYSARSMTDRDVAEERQRLCSLDGDLFSYINYYSRWLALRAQGHDARPWCRRAGIEQQRFFEITKLRNQFREIVTDAGLLRNAPQATDRSELTQSERMAKHGERKLYQKLKREHDQNKHKKRKVLSLGFDAATTSNERDHENDDDDDDDRQDKDGKRHVTESKIKDIEFKLVFDAKHLIEVEEGHRLRSADVQIVKLLLAISFYPQLAIADADNSYRADCDQMFHTKDKPFVVLHPTSVYYNQPEILKPEKVEHSSLGSLSSQHALLGYISLIETNKTYISNCYTISALHALLLCARELDTNRDMSRIVCDDWIELQCVSCEEAQDMLLQALQIRHAWSRFFENMFQGLVSLSDFLAANDDDDGKDGGERKRTGSGEEPQHANKSHENEDEMRALKHRIAIYLRTRPKYAMRRLLSADVKCLHSGEPLDPAEECDPSDDDNWREHKPIRWLLREQSVAAAPNEIKGGIRLANLNFNCLQVNQTDELLRASRREYVCSRCAQRMHLSPIEWSRHEQICAEKQEAAAAKTTSTGEKPELDSDSLCDEKATYRRGKQRYNCPQCDRQFCFSQLDILRHRQMHGHDRNADNA